MGIWFRQPQVLAGEHELFRGATNRLGRIWRDRTVGGILLVTDRRLAFEPNRLDWVLGARSWTVNVSEIISFEKKVGGLMGLRSSGLYGIRPQVVVRVGDATEVFTVRYPERLLSALATLTHQSPEP